MLTQLLKTILNVHYIYVINELITPYVFYQFIAQRKYWTGSVKCMKAAHCPSVYQDLTSLVEACNSESQKKKKNPFQIADWRFILMENIAQPQVLCGVSTRNNYIISLLLLLLVFFLTYTFHNFIKGFIIQSFCFPIQK